MELEEDTQLAVGGDAPHSQPKVQLENFKKPHMCLVGQRKSKGAKVRLLDCSTDISKKHEKISLSETWKATSTDESKVTAESSEVSSSETETIVEKHDVKSSSLSQTSENPKPRISIPSQKLKESPIPYVEPKWGGMPDTKYTLEVIKSGTSLKPLNLSDKSYFIFGRQTNCDVQMAHPTVSRYHAVLQYSGGSDDKSAGFYLYDLGSTHGTFLNKSRIRPEMYVRIKVGHQIKLGCSSRFFLLQGPPDDMEDESELTVTELKAKRQLELLEREAAEISRQKMEEEKQKKSEEEGIDWGMGDDADEETDLSENPYAATTNEELYIDDPKKTLRGWFEREGHELEYDVEEKGPGHFLCRIEVPVEGARGGSVVAEALLKGKKKEAVAQCALEACRLLDRLGLLRQATHESRKRKAKNWEEEDFYDSDEDTFLDRTGAVEKKRQQRMQHAGKGETQVATYQSLSEKHAEILKEMANTEAQLLKAQAALARAKMKDGEDEDNDSLDSFMSKLSNVGCTDKKLISQLKANLTALKKEEVQVRKLVNIARPASLPELIAPCNVSEAVSPKGTIALTNKLMHIASKRINEKNKAQDSTSTTPFDCISVTGLGVLENDEHDDVNTLSIETDPDRRLSGPSSTLEDHSSRPIESTRKDPLNPSVIDDGSSADKLYKQLPLETEEENHRKGEDCDNDDNHDERNLREAEKRRKKNQRRLLLRKEKALEKTKDQYDTTDPNYSVWVPPEDQSGDGKTSLNAKLGY